MTMISGGDESARNAFRAYLRDESSQRGLVTTEEMTAADVLEVKNLADAIARAEEAMRAESSRPRSKRDMFAELAAATDDASGPAVFAAARPTPIPPPPAAAPAPIPPPPATDPVILVPNEEDAFLQPAGRMRSFADETLDGYRPEPTLELRIRARRSTASWVVAGAVAVLGIVAIAAFALGRSAEAPAPPVVAAPAKTIAKVEEPQPARVDAPPATATIPVVPVMDVRSLPTAK